VFDVNEMLLDIKPMFPLAEKPEFDAADLLGFAEKRFPTPANEAATAVTKLAVGSWRRGRDRSGLHSEKGQKVEP
jgi:hypothetical protein